MIFLLFVWFCGRGRKQKTLPSRLLSGQECRISLAVPPGLTADAVLSLCARDAPDFDNGDLTPAPILCRASPAVLLALGRPYCSVGHPGLTPPPGRWKIPYPDFSLPHRFVRNSIAHPRGFVKAEDFFIFPLCPVAPHAKDRWLRRLRRRRGG